MCKIQGSIHQFRSSVNFTVEAIDKNSLRKSYTDSDIVKKMTQQATLNENFSENDLNL